MPITTLGFDADDTLWHNESLFRITETRFAKLLGDHAEPEAVSERLLATERRNLAFYGYGVKGFTLSMIETAVEITGGDCPSEITAEILGYGREMLGHPVECLPGVAETLEALAPRYGLVLITKGDLFDQERKVAQSGLGELFRAVEIVSEKTAATYADVFARDGTGAAEAMMIGNSVRSDVAPALEAGAWGVRVPYRITCAMEHADPPEEHPRFRRLDAIAGVPELIGALS